MAITVRAKRPIRTQSASTPDEVTSPIILQLRPVIDLTPDQLLELSSLNDDLRFELTAEGALSIMAPTGWDGGHQNAGITAQLWMWAEQEGSGATGDSSTLFKLPNGAIRSPDAAWITNARLATIPAAQRRKPLPLCPDFVVELREWAIDLSAAEVPSGRFRLTVRNVGEKPHVLNIEQELVVARQPWLAPGEQGVVEVTLLSGNYHFICPIAGHEAYGMETSLTVLN